jgi:hypothetical protein
MSATRSRIDRNLDRLQTRLADTRARQVRRAAGLAAFAVGMWLAARAARSLAALARRGLRRRRA